MSFRPGRFLGHAAIVFLVLTAALAVFSRFGGSEIALCNLVVRAQKGSTYQLAAPPGSAPEAHREVALHPVTDEPRVRNLILFIGDGMGIGHISAASALLDHAGAVLAMTDTRHLALVRTWAADTVATDSGASGTAIATGFKTRKKAIGVREDGTVVRNLFEAARERGLMTGVVTTSGLVDATPASFTAHVDHRDMYAEILEQMLSSGTDIMIGGDWVGQRKSRKNKTYMRLVHRIGELASEHGYNLARDEAELLVMPAPLLAFFPSRPGFDEQHGPPLAVSARRAIELMADSPEGYILVIESEVTDQMAHTNDIAALVDAIRELDEAVRQVLELTSPAGDTLVLVTADHDTGTPALVDGCYEDHEATVRWATGEHSSQWVPLFAFGPGSEQFSGVLDNTDLPHMAAALLDLAPLPSLADSASN
jgi:alkaline phosphatase